MSGRRIAVALALACGTAGAEWTFAPPVTVAPPSPQVFPHLEAAGRASLAVGSDGTVAVVWEDNRSGRPEVYLATRHREGKSFSAPRRLSAGDEAFEPAVAAVAGGFLVLWEEGGTIRGRAVTAGGAGEATVLVDGPAAQATVTAVGDGSAYVAWSRGEGRGSRIEVARVNVAPGIELLWRQPVEAAPTGQPQLYPSLAPGAGGLVVAWEDRRHGHTRLYTARMTGEGRFTPPRQLNELRDGNAPYGRGSGVTRVTLAEGGGRTAAVWMDKRAYQSGYDIYAAVSAAGDSFGANELVQDLFGENLPQWHPDIAVSAEGRVVAAWDDPRDGSPDVWFSWREGDGAWSGDAALPGGSGDGAQTHPVIAFGPDGRLHAAWVDRPEEGAPAIRYSVGEWEGR